MYQSFFGFQAFPFSITPDPAFLYPSPSHREALATIVYGVDQRKGFVLLTGEVGSGKTTVVRSYLEQVDRDRVKPVYVFNPDLPFKDLLRTVMQELGVDTHDDEYEMLRRLYEIVIEEYRQDRNVVMIVDEAQNMPVETLESLRTLSNLETPEAKLLQIVLVGQPELDEKIGRTELRQLRQRMAVRATLRPLTLEESAEYVLYRLGLVTQDKENVFSPRAVDTIVRRAQGSPRLINILCDNALIASYGLREKRVSARTARMVIRDFDRTLAREGGPSKTLRYVLLGGAGLACVALAAYAGLLAGSRAARSPGAVKPRGSIARVESPAEPASADLVAVSETQPTATPKVPERDDSASRRADRAAHSTIPRPTPPTTPSPTSKPVGPLLAPDRVASVLPVQEATTPTLERSALSDASPAAASRTPRRVAVEPVVPAGKAPSVPPAEGPTTSSVERTVVSADLPVPAETTIAAAVTTAGSPRAEIGERAYLAPFVSRSTPSPPSLPSRAARDGIVARRTVRRGDYLSRLCIEIYGNSTPEILEKVKKINPNIRDVNIILIDDEIVFPDLNVPEPVVRPSE
ncbi:AAA family ATPase [Candidatus Sumerlaeota bacterium]|nr:AAA family ATPase [Candidatus Sumerlaeota bacterium]